MAASVMFQTAFENAQIIMESAGDLAYQATKTATLATNKQHRYLINVTKKLRAFS
jgi:hypothetical protein